jgi:IMP dehydrogenase
MLSDAHMVIRKGGGGSTLGEDARVGDGRVGRYLKTVAELRLVPVWVNPDHLVSTARYVMAGHKLRAIGVLDGSALIGTLSFEELAGADESRRVADVMVPVRHTVQGQSRVRSVAALMASENLDFVPAVEDGKFLGMVTAPMLLKEMSRTWDPLTGLSWSDRLREWGIEHLRDGDEVLVIFIDLDDFGTYNKRYGHIVGDRVLQKVARYLTDTVDEGTDVLVRYGGDEFAIATIRSRQGAESLVQLIEHRIAGTFIGEAERPVELSIGLAGGRRTHERDNIHFAATMDNLINLASRDCMAAKSAKKMVTRPTTEQEASAPQDESETPEKSQEAAGHDVRVVEVLADDRSPKAVTMVTLSRDGQLARGVHVRSGEMTAVESVVRATINALERGNPELRIVLKDVELREADGKVNEVQVYAANRNEDGDQELAASLSVTGDVYLAAAEATVEALKQSL